MGLEQNKAFKYIDNSDIFYKTIQAKKDARYFYDLWPSNKSIDFSHEVHYKNYLLILMI